jgi:hypothetical protein
VEPKTPKRPEILAQWSRVAFPVDVASRLGPRRERLVKAISDAMQKPLSRRRPGRGPLRRFAVTVAAAALVLVVVGTVLARTGGRSHAPPAPIAPRPPEVVVNLPIESGKASEDEQPSVAPTSDSAVFGDPRAVARSAEQGARSPTPSPSTTLADQNRLFADAMTARRGGQRDRSLGLLEQLIQKYPRSSLAQDAHVERFRILAEEGDGEAAARAARAYLAFYPRGFAAEEAQRLVATPMKRGAP